MKAIICVFSFIFFSNLSLVQGQSITGENLEIEERYFTALDHSSYIELILYKGGEFVYKYKFEAAGILENKGSWKRSKNKIMLYNVSNVTTRPPTIFKKKWFIIENQVCTKKNAEKKNAVCLVSKNKP